MDRTIKVKGTGKVSVRPDLVVITMKLESRHADYDKTMEIASTSAAALTDAVVIAGFSREALKTSHLNIRTDYESYHDEKNHYKTRFIGYVFDQHLKLEFDFDQTILSRVLNAIAGASVTPHLTIQFTVKDKEVVNADLLKSAVSNAQSKAEILCEAAGVAMGSLLNIDYSWVDSERYSGSDFTLEKISPAPRTLQVMDLEPENIEASDTVTCLWDII